MKTATDKTAASIAVMCFILAVFGSTALLSQGLIGEATFIGLIVIALGAGCLIAFWEKIDYLKMSEFEIKFREVKETEEAVKALARDIAAVAEELNRGALVTHEFDQARFDRALTELKKKAGDLGAPTDSRT